jgi:hypothetical protein
VEHNQLAASRRKLRPRQEVALTKTAFDPASQTRPGEYRWGESACGIFRFPS